MILLENIIVETDTDTKDCFKDFNVKFYDNGTEYKGFLKKSNLLTLNANKIDCKRIKINSITHQMENMK